MARCVRAGRSRLGKALVRCDADLSASPKQSWAPGDRRVVAFAWASEWAVRGWVGGGSACAPTDLPARTLGASVGRSSQRERCAVLAPARWLSCGCDAAMLCA